ncbi:monovalent cation/H(+) antiporter subunit G [Thermus sediminis]|uniref:monovalent cation/H(+) antiporter subunit G n=1 Tax=Thermus sediminis TaxID=1761908 RepID=UPI000E3DCBCC|nr:monovalent cation/H(+) antiporter subunit G [Thermus sediminis]
MLELLVALLLLAGAFFVLVAALGVLRFPDLLMRMHASTKAGTLGVGLIVLAAVAHFGELGITAKGLVGVFFILLTAPVGAHVIARAAYLVGVRLWEKTVVNERDGGQGEEAPRLARGKGPGSTEEKK